MNSNHFHRLRIVDTMRPWQGPLQGGASAGLSGCKAGSVAGRRVVQGRVEG